MLRLLLSLSLALALISSPVWADGKPEIVDVGGFFNDTFHDYTEEMETAKEEGKKAILIMFEMDECPFCHRMKTSVLNRKDIQDFFQEHFMVYSLDIEGDIEMTDFAGKATTQADFALEQHRVRATPVFQFFDLEGKPIKKGRITGATKDAAEFKLFGEFILSGEYETKSFFKYKRELEKAAKDEKKG